jgi:hypothetical protein
MIGDGDCGEIGGMKICRVILSTRRKSAPAPLCPPQNQHDYADEINLNSFIIDVIKLSSPQRQH